MTKFDALRAHHAAHADTRILDLMTPDRARDYAVSVDGLLFDYAKTTIDDTARDLLLAVADGWTARRDAMFAGQKINETEGRAVLHTALRRHSAPVIVDGEDVIPGVQDTLSRMRAFATAIRDGSLTGQGGAYTDVVNIGIGGSDLGPVMAMQALAPYADGPRTHFVSNVDGAHIADKLEGLDPATTLIIIASKTFTTIETMTNARTAWDWMARVVDEPGAQFAALSSATDKTAEWGIAPDRVFGFEDWVGGRYSMWGPIGLSVMIGVGGGDFDQVLAGGAAMDDHVLAADGAANMPLMLALVGIWHNQVCGHATRAVLPYDQRLNRLPAYLQQLEMESNGKSVAMDGSDLPYDCGPIVWGEPGTNGQHAFYQLIHQGTRVVPCEFIVAREGHEPNLAHQHRLLQANCL
ncbi:MAG: glucose-6-phosphate isomerase, partial [Pseudomonadota bacterium]